MDEQIKNLMTALKITEAEAIEIIKADEEIDKMPMKEVNNDLTADQQKVVKKYKNAGTKKTEYQFTKRERKPDEEKISIVKALADFLSTAKYDNITISNPSKQVDFTINGVAYSLSLTRHRPPKAESH